MPLTVRDRIALAAAAAAVVAWGAAAWLLIAAPGDGPPAESELTATEIAIASGTTPPHGETGASRNLIVDVEGAVARPGLVTLRSGARIADAIRSAGGYSRDADAAAAATSLNLAATLTDGQQVYVPRIGETPVAGPAGPGTAGSATGATVGGLVNLNTATPEALEALPGIGPVTTQKIVAGRAEQAFTSLEEMVQRDVLDNGQAEEIRDLVTF
jgi:competence protein ComEA